MTTALAETNVVERRVPRAEEGSSSAASYRSLIHGALHGIYRSNMDGTFLIVNPALVELLGYESEAELLSVDMAKDVYVNSSERAEVIEHYKDADRIEALEVEWRRKDGRPVTVRLSGRTVRNAQGQLECFEMIAEDVTERHRLEAQLRQAQKMEAIGQLTGGIAHDFNNLLTVIRANADFAAGSLPPTMSELRTDLEEVQAAARRGTELIKKLLGFGRRQRLDFRPVDLRKLVADFSAMLQRVMPANIQVELDLDRPSGMVRADSGAVEQMLLNAATNARDAMPDGGVLSVSVVEAFLDDRYQRLHPWCTPGRYVCLSMADTGVGMDRETLERVFDPFFTTKAVGEGSGLGMAMVYGLTKQHRGHVHVYSEVGQGTTLRLYLPISNGECIGDSETNRSACELPRGSETILVAEDEVAIRRATKRALESHGYTVLLAEDGEHALELYHAHESEVDLVMSDMVMPGLNGGEVLDALRRSGKGPKVILISGYSARDARNSGAFRADVPFLEKPWSVSDLLLCVRGVLDQQTRREPDSSSMPAGPTLH